MWNWFGYILQGAGKHAEAVADFSRAIDLNPKVGRFYLNRSRSYEALGDEERSRQDYEAAVKWDPKLAK